MKEASREHNLRPLAAIALNTLREILRDKVIYAFFVFALVIALFGLILGSLSVGQDVRMILDLGLFGINTIGGIIAVFAGANLVYKELEKKTCYLIFTRPVKSWQFILGKYLGLSTCLAILVVAMGIFLALIVYFVDASHAFNERAFWIAISVAMVYLELLVIIAAAEFFSTFASPIMSVVFTVSFWMIGHFSASLQEFARLMVNPAARQLASILYWALPDLQSLTRARYLIMYGNLPGAEFSLYLSAYIIAYSIILLVLAALVNERRELP